MDPPRLPYPVVLLLALLGGCASQDTVVIGMGYPDHPVGTLVEESLTTLRAAGHPIELDWHPSAATRAAATALTAEVDRAAQLVLDRRLVGAVHHGGSREALMTTPIYNEQGVPVILATATSRRLRTAGRWTFQMAPDDSVEGEFIGAFATGRLGARTATLFYVVDEYGMGLRDGVTAALTRIGARVLDAAPIETRATCGDGRANSHAGVVDGALRRGRPDVVIIAARQSETGCVLEHLRRRYPSMRYVAGDGVLADSTFLVRAGEVDSLFIVGFWHPDLADSTSSGFKRRFEAVFGRPPTGYDAMNYDAHLTLVDAVLGGARTREEVRFYLASLGHGRPPRAGVTGPIAFPAGPERLLMQRLEQGRMVLVGSR